jgi:Concanavalin A-like lectin/glucanases superfamily
MFEGMRWAAFFCWSLCGCGVLAGLDEFGPGLTSGSGGSTATSGTGGVSDGVGGATGGAGGALGGAGGIGGAADAYAALVMADSPLAYWRLAQPSSMEAHDEVTSGLLGSFEPGVSLDQPGVLADNSCASFVGNGARLSVPDDAKFDFTGQAEFSLEAWIFIDEAKDAPIFHKFTQSEGYRLQLENGALRFARGTTATTDDVFSAVDLPLGQWVHLVGSYRAPSMQAPGELTVYLQGVQSNKTATSDLQLLNTNVPLRIGNDYGADPSIDGRLDEVVVYDSVLEPARIQAHYQAGIAAGR